MNLQLVVIDPQKDFTCPPGYDPSFPEGGSLYVPGAEKDMERLAAMIDRLRGKISDIHITLDSHHRAQVFHPMWWKDAQGNHPAPFTAITVDDVQSHRWTTTNPAFYQKGLDYVKALQDGGRYNLTIWPFHCLIGSEGAAVIPCLFKAISQWEMERFGMVSFKPKGSNIFTEHYSALKAEVIDPSDPTTQIDAQWVQTLLEADIILLAGEALSHCVANTVLDTANAFGDDSFIKKMHLLTDATTAIPGCDAEVKAFLDEMTSRGMNLANTTDFLA